jgi:hypothetical protein
MSSQSIYLNTYNRKAASKNQPDRIVVHLAEPGSWAGKDLNYTSKYTGNKHKTIFNIYILL